MKKNTQKNILIENNVLGRICNQLDVGIVKIQLNNRNAIFFVALLEVSECLLECRNPTLG
jgi:hypothetical protein